MKPDTEFYIVYDVATGELRWPAAGPVGSAASQVLGEGLAALVVPQTAIAGPTVDIEAAKGPTEAAIDAQANALIEGIREPERHMIDMIKLIEAKAGTGPFLTLEAKMTGQKIKDVASSVVAAHQKYAEQAAPIEAGRVAAKKALRKATTFTEIASALAALTAPTPT